MNRRTIVQLIDDAEKNFTIAREVNTGESIPRIEILDESNLRGIRNELNEWIDALEKQDSRTNVEKWLISIAKETIEAIDVELNGI